MKKTCPICGKLFDKKRMIGHIKKLHDGYKGIKEARAILKVNAPKPKQKNVSCPYCNKKVIEEHLKIHMKEWHSTEYQRDFPLSAKQKLALALKPNGNVKSNDIMDTRYVVSGGGVGVGKGKK